MQRPNECTQLGRLRLAVIVGKYDDVAAKLNRKPKDIGKSRFTLGDQVALFPCSAKSDVLVFVQGEGQVAAVEPVRRKQKGPGLSDQAAR